MASSVSGLNANLPRAASRSRPVFGTLKCSLITDENDWPLRLCHRNASWESRSIENRCESLVRIDDPAREGYGVTTTMPAGRSRSKSDTLQVRMRSTRILSAQQTCNAS